MTHNTVLVIIGTHDIQSLQIVIKESIPNAMVVYSKHSCAAGALLIFALIQLDLSGSNVHITRSTYLAVNRITSLNNYTLPCAYSGQYRVFVYDIESDGTLASGVGYPAVTTELITSGVIPGRFGS